MCSLCADGIPDATGSIGTWQLAVGQWSEVPLSPTGETPQ